MNTAILNQFNLQFSNIISGNNRVKIATSGTNKLLADVLTFIKESDEISDFIMEEIENLDSQNTMFDFTINFTYIRVFYNDNTNFYLDENENMGAPDYSLTTSDFIDLLNEWKMFLEDYD